MVWVARGGFVSVASYAFLAVVMAAVKVGLMVWVPSGWIEMRRSKRVCVTLKVRKLYR